MSAGPPRIAFPQDFRRWIGRRQSSCTNDQAAATAGDERTRFDTKLLTRFDELEQLAAEWDRLWAANPQGEVFGSFHWMRAWWRVYGDRRALSTPAVFENGRLVGLLPLVRDGRTLRFVGSPGADYNDVLCDGGRAAEVVAELLRAVTTLVAASERCQLENVSADSILASHLSALPASIRARLQCRASGPCPSVQLGARRDEVIDAILKKPSVRRHRDKLQRAGRLTFRHVTDRNEIKRHLPTFFRQHVTRRAMAGGRSSFMKPEARLLCEALVDELDPGDRLRFAVLELDDRPIAYHFGFEYRGKFMWYKPAFDVNCWDYSPGEVMLSCLFEYAGARRLDEFDFTRGGEATKDRFANHVRQNLALQIFPAGGRGGAAHRAHRLREWIKTHQIVFAALKAGRSRLAGWRGAAAAAVRQGGVLGFARQIAARLARGVFARDDMLVFIDGPIERHEGLHPPPGSDIEIELGTLADAAG